MTTAKKYPEVFAKCRRGSDRLTQGDSCSSMRALNMSEPGAHVVTMQCVKCKFTWNVGVGGVTTH
jgi:hypothetical protein